MKAVLGCLALSLAIHAAALLRLPDARIEGQGNAGADTLSISGGAGEYAALLAAWDRPPDTAQVPEMSTPTTPLDVPELRPETALSRPNVPQVPAPAIEATPMPSTQPNAPPPRPNVPTVTAFPGLGQPSPETHPTGTPDTLQSAPLTRTVPSLTPLGVEEVVPQPDTRPFFEGATALATDASPRPAERPEDLAPPPAPTPTPAPAQTPAPATAATPAPAAPQRNGAGQGGTTQGAATQPAPTPAPAAGPSAAQIQSLIAQWGGQIQARIARARPSVSGSGRAVVQLSVAPSGQLVGLGLARSSGNAAVDQAALGAVRRVGRFPRAPQGLTNGSYTFSVPLTFQ